MKKTAWFNRARSWNVEAGEAGGVLVRVADEHHVVVSADGSYRGSPGIEDHLVVVVQTEAGQEMLTLAQFGRRYGWKNEPAKAYLWPPN